MKWMQTVCVVLALLVCACLLQSAGVHADQAQEFSAESEIMDMKSAMEPELRDVMAEHVQTETQPEYLTGPAIFPVRSGNESDDDVSNFAQPPITYHGGPVIHRPVLYLIWYGSWNPVSSFVSILKYFAQHLAPSGYWNIEHPYTDFHGSGIANLLGYGGAYFDAGSQGLNLNLNNPAVVFQIVVHAINSGHLPLNDNGIYVVLTDRNVHDTSGYHCHVWCAWHYYGTYLGHHLSFGLVPNTSPCPAACAPPQNQHVSPNGNVVADAMCNLFAHEVEEAASDPFLNAWYDSNGLENADKCAWTWGPTHIAPNGATYNLCFPPSPPHKCFLIQQNWVNVAPQHCALKYP